MRAPRRGFLVAGCLLLVAGVTGCEALQRKFTRKPKHPTQRPTPVIQFHDYTYAMTPVERYRKHYLLFDYWNAQLLSELSETSRNAKRLRHNSAEALGELDVMVNLLDDETAGEVAPLVEDRRAMDQAVRRGDVRGVSANRLRKDVERQTRTIQGRLYWRNVEDRLKPIE